MVSGRDCSESPVSPCTIPEHITQSMSAATTQTPGFLNVLSFVMNINQSHEPATVALIAYFVNEWDI